MKLSAALACSLGLTGSCGLQSSFDVHTSSSFSSDAVKGSGVVVEEARDIAAFELVAAEADVKASGSSDASVNAKVLRAHASGSSDIRYRGLPEKLTSSDRGLGYVGPEGT